MDRERRLAGSHERRVVEDVVDVAVGVGDEMEAQPVRGDAFHERCRGSHARIEHQGVGGAAVPDEVGVRLPRAERADLQAHAVIGVWCGDSGPLDDGAVAHSTHRMRSR